jgi:23S rRNA (uracil1939-C5)-methyltransferase
MAKTSSLPLRRGDTVSLAIEAIGQNGDGIARQNHLVFFVANTAAGDVITAKLVEQHKVGWRGELIAVTEASPTRIKPPCIHYPECGGCQLQHLHEEAYRSWKLSTLTELLAKKSIVAKEILPLDISPPQSRRRASLTAYRGTQKLSLGFHKRRSQDIIDQSMCEILLPAITAMLPSLRHLLLDYLDLHQQCDVHITHLYGRTELILVGGKKPDVKIMPRLLVFAKAETLALLGWREWDRSPVEILYKGNPLTLRYGDVSIDVPAATFLQATEAGEKSLIAFAKNYVRKDTKVLDLFAGIGAFGLSAGDENTDFIDWDGPAIGALKKALGPTRSKHVQSRDLTAKPLTADELAKYDCVILDPPRGGAKKQTAALAASSLRHIIYISCDPDAFVRDAGILIDAGFKLEALQPVDQFLWSTHLELAAYFQR